MTEQEQALRLTMEAVGIADLQAVMLDEALIRFEMIKCLDGPLRYTADGPIELTRELVQQFIGLRIQSIHHLTKSEFHLRLIDLMRAKAKRVVNNPLLDKFVR